MTNETIITVLATIVSLILLKFVVLFTLGGGSLAQLWPSTRVFFQVFRDPAAAAKAAAALNPPPPEPPKPVKPSAEPLRLLALLQREGRLLDFLLEDLSGASD